MVITSIGSYITTADEVIAHGTDVNTDRAANTLPELTLAGGYTIADFIADRNALDSKITSLVGLENAIEEAIDNRDAQKINVRDRLGQFRLALRIDLKGTTYFKRVPTLPRVKTTESKFLRPFDDMADMWARIDAETGIPGFAPPLELTGGYTLAGFTADLATLRAYYMAVTDAENDEDIARKERDVMLDPLRERMFQYRATIELEYGKGHPFYESLPEVSASSGSSEETITAGGFWDGPSNEAVINWSPATDPNVDHYEVRVTQGATYDPNNATVAGSVPPGELEFRTTEGLASPGDTAAFRVFAVLTGGDELESNTVVVTRP